MSRASLVRERNSRWRRDLNDIRAAGLWTPGQLRAKDGRQARKDWSGARTAKKCPAATGWVTSGEDWGCDPPAIVASPGCEFGVSKVAQIPLRDALWRASTDKPQFGYLRAE
jgi:hypothetical protein